MNKYMLCDYARSDWGKSQTLLKVIELLKDIANPVIEEQIGAVDKFAVFIINEKKIVVNTQGDPDSYQEEGLARAVKEKAHVIVCASRSKGSTYDCVKEYEKNDYEIIWFRNFYANNDNLPCVAYLPELMASAIVNLIKTIIII